MRLQSAQEQVASWVAAINGVRNEASDAVRELRDALNTEQRNTDALQQRLHRGDGGRQGRSGSPTKAESARCRRLSKKISYAARRS